MTKRKILSAVLALVLVVSLAAPAFAASWGGIGYDLIPNLGATSSKVTMQTHNVTVSVTAKGRAYVHILQTDDYAWGNWSSASGTSSATAYVNNYVYDDYGTLYTGTILNLKAQGYIGSNLVENTTV